MAIKNNFYKEFNYEELNEEHKKNVDDFINQAVIKLNQIVNRETRVNYKAYTEGVSGTKYSYIEIIPIEEEVVVEERLPPPPKKRLPKPLPKPIKYPEAPSNDVDEWAEINAEEDKRKKALPPPPKFIWPTE